MLSEKVLNVGGNLVPVVIADFSHRNKITQASLFPLGYSYSKALDKWNLNDQACDYIFSDRLIPDFEIPGTLGIILNDHDWRNNKHKERHYPLFDSWDAFENGEQSDTLNFILTGAEFILNRMAAIKNNKAGKIVFVFESNIPNAMQELRRMFIEKSLHPEWASVPVIIKRTYTDHGDQEIQLRASAECGALLLDGFGDGVWLNAVESISEKQVNTLSFGILQATRTRISKTEYISCPSCGRTLFDLQETTAKIRARTEHLKGIKIGIMGCIVNGPGEMADADYGYVGTGPGKITLYKGQNVVQRNIDESHAVDELIQLIKSNGDWVEPANLSEVLN
jgi:(E)-4-hydroxy-3-methylbut-2-enyl-diphosphate synthase